MEIKYSSICNRKNSHDCEFTFTTQRDRGNRDPSDFFFSSQKQRDTKILRATINACARDATEVGYIFLLIRYRKNRMTRHHYVPYV